MIRRASRSTTVLLGTALLGAGAGWLAGHGERRRLHRELAAVRRDAIHDPLTGLLNRRGLDHATSRLVAPSFLGLLNVDGLKAVNDTCGHAVGDTVLRTVAERLARHVGRLGPVARLGGDEFVVILGGHDRDQATATARDLHVWLAAPIRIGQRWLHVTASIGLAEVGRTTTAHALRAADLAMYRAKTTGAGVGVYCPDADGPATISPRPDHRVRDSRAGRSRPATLPA